MTEELDKPGTISVTLGEGEGSLTLLLRPLPKERLMLILIKHAKAISEFERLGGEADARGERSFRFPKSGFLTEMKDLIVGSAVDWEGVRDGRGKPLPFSRPALERTFERNKSLYASVLAAVGEMAAYWSRLAERKE